MMPLPAPHIPRPRVATEADPELDAYNAAFDELELEWRWDRGVMRDLAGIGAEKDRIAAYLRAHRPHLLKVYDADALAAEIVEVKNRLLSRRAGRSN
jgi:hypothetical protein